MNARQRAALLRSADRLTLDAGKILDALAPMNWTGDGRAWPRDSMALASAVDDVARASRVLRELIEATK